MERGIADISGFLQEVRAHTVQTGGDKYAKDRQYEPADVLTEWFGDSPLLWTCCKYLTRLPRTKKKEDFFKALHYLGMEYNRVFGKPKESGPAPATDAPLMLKAATGAKANEDFVVQAGDMEYKFTNPSKQIGFMFDLFMKALQIFEKRNKVRGTSNVNAIGALGCALHVREKGVRAVEVLKQLDEGVESVEERMELVEDYTDSCFDATNWSIMGLAKHLGLWPAERTVQDVGSPT